MSKATSDQINTALQSGGVVLFAGGKNPIKAGPGFLLTCLIDLFTKCNYSHSAVAMPANGSAPYIFESTIDGSINGPQISDLAGRIAGYRKEGGHAWLFPFLPEFAPDWSAVESAASLMVAERLAGKMRYSVPRLFADAIEMSWVFGLIALPADGIITYLAAHDKGLVCSELVGLLCQAGGVTEKLKAAGVPWLPKVMPPGQPIGCGPNDIANVPMFAPSVQLL